MRNIANRYASKREHSAGTSAGQPAL